MLGLRIFSLLLLIVLAYFSTAQNCFEYHEKYCIVQSSKYVYEQSPNSLSFVFKEGESKHIPLDLHADKDYRITICCDSVFNNVVSFVILRQDGSVLYDNSKHNYALNIEFSSRQTQEAFIVVELPETNSALPAEGCMGILIEYMLSLKMGF